MEDFATIVQRVSIVLPTLLAALVLHEYAHAWMAKRFGDDTADWSGRLTLNPTAHMDLFGSLIFPLIALILNSGFLFAWAKPVPINPTRFRNYRKGLFWVSSAGIILNILLGFIAAFALIAFLKFASPSFPLYEAFKEMLYNFVFLNFVLAIFNLIPIPPLDGSNIVLSFLKYNAAQKFVAFQNYSFYIMLFLMFSGALRIIAYPIYALSQFAIFLAAQVLGFASPL